MNKANVIHLFKIPEGNRFSFELKLKHAEHLDRIILRQHALMDASKQYKKGG